MPVLAARRTRQRALASSSPVATGELVAAVAFALLLGLASLAAGAVASAAAAQSAWEPVAVPGGAAWSINDITCFGAVNVALAGDGHVAVSRDAGRTWTTSVPAGHDGTAFTAVAFGTTGRGVLASGGLLLVSADWGATWAPPSYAVAPPDRAVNDVALRGAHALAVGDGGMIFSSSDAGATWTREASPVTAALTSVALAADGTAVAGSEVGDVLVRTLAWATAGSAGAPVTAVSAVATPVWADGRPDLFAATEHDVLGSDDGATFASLPGLPDLSGASWGTVVWAGQPDDALLVAGGGDAGFFSPAGSWVAGPTGFGGLLRAAAPGDQSTAYLLDAEGLVARTLSAGREPAAIALSSTRITVGGTARYSATVSVAAPGALVLRTRVPGRAWATARRVSWAAGDWGRTVRFDLEPSLTHEYQLDFAYGGTTTQIAPRARVTVVPRVLTSTARYVLRRGAVFRFSGTVRPQLKGERVELYTDRGGGWRPVSLQSSVALVDGRTWRSRSFGTPVAETYRLRAHLRATRTHAEAWSRIVTVTVR